MQGPACQVIRCPRAFRPAALKLLHLDLPSDQQAVLVQILSNLDPAEEALWDGLFVAARCDTGFSSAIAEALAEPGTHSAAVLWIQLAAGNTAVVWTAPATSEEAQALLHAAADFVDRREIPLAQTLVGEHDGYDDAIQSRCGFPRFARLAYLFAEVAQLSSEGAADNPTASDPSRTVECEGLHFVPRAGDEPQRLAALLEQTYIGTLDCPALDGVRPMSDVLAGYRAQGRYSADDWYFVQENDRDIGALLLAEHPGYGNWELVYMGVVPQARGRKRGERIVRFALEVAADRGAERLVLAVDEANAPALRAYERAGFVTWDRRIVYARLRSPS